MKAVTRIVYSVEGQEITGFTMGIPPTTDSKYIVSRVPVFPTTIGFVASILPTS